MALAALLAWAAPARATNHLWDISEVFTNSSGTVQFVEMHDSFNVEGFLNGTTLTAMDSTNTQSHVFTFNANTTDPIITAGHSVLIATAGFGSLPGGVTPDFILPANFLFMPGGSLEFSASFDSISYSSIPTDGIMSLTRNLDVEPHTLDPAVNSPRNFAGATGSVPEPASGAAVLLVGVALAVRGRARARI